MKRSTILFIILSLSIILSAATERCVVRIPDPGAQAVEQLFRNGSDIASYLPGSHLDLVVNQEERARLREQYPEQLVTQTEAQLKNHLQSDKDIPGYHTYSQLVTELMSLQAQYPSLVQTSIIGTGWGAQYSAQGISPYMNFDHDIWAVKVSANVQLEEDEPAFFFVGDHHAREPLSTEVCLGILNHLTENYSIDPLVTNIMNSCAIWIVPLVNPDGHKIVLDQTDVWWRKNIRDNNANLSFDHDDWGAGNDGVDINRNYGYYWGYTSATDDIYDPTYHGTGPFSEPESQAFRDLLLSRRFLAGIGYHTYGEYVLYPYGYVSGIAGPDQPELQALAYEIASQLPALSGGNYAPGPSYGLYPVSGSLDDWAYGATGAFSFTIEMAEEFIPSLNQVNQIVPQQVGGAMTLLQRQFKKILRGHVTDDLTGAPLRARIFVQGIDDQPVNRAPIYADSLYGSYYYFLPAGNYTVTYFCPGYWAEVRQVTIWADQPTLEDVSLIPNPGYQLVIQVQDDFFDPLPGVTLNIPTLSDESFVSDEFGIITITDFHAGLHRLVASKPGYETVDFTRSVYAWNITLRLNGQPLLTEDFELNLLDWSATGSWNRTPNQHFGGSYSLADSPSGNYANNGSSSCRLLTPLSLFNLDNANLQFQLKTALALDGDCLLLEWSTDGNAWRILDFYTGTADWSLKSYNLNYFSNQSLYLRFRMQTDEWGSSDGVYIDDFKFFANADASAVENGPIPQPSLSLSAGPNPFFASCNISFRSASAPSGAKLEIFNQRGQIVRSFALDTLSPGGTDIVWDGRDRSGSAVANGIYLLRVSTPDGLQVSRKVLRLK